MVNDQFQGPHSWPGAKAAILGVEERVFNCTMTRRTKETEKSKPINKFYAIKLLV